MWWPGYVGVHGRAEALFGEITTTLARKRQRLGYDGGTKVSRAGRSVVQVQREG